MTPKLARGHLPLSSTALPGSPEVTVRTARWKQGFLTELPCTVTLSRSLLPRQQPLWAGASCVLRPPVSQLLPDVVTSASASGLWGGQPGQDRVRGSTPDGDSNTNRTPSGRGDENESLLPNFIEETSSMRFPSCDSCDLLRVSVGKLGSSWKTLRLGGGGVRGGFSLAWRRS